MKSLQFIVLLCLLASLISFGQEPQYPHTIFTNSRMSGNYFYSKVSYDSTSWIRNMQYKLPISDSIFFTPGNALQFQFKNGKSGNWSAAVYKPRIRGQDNIQPGDLLSFKIYVASAKTNTSNLPVVSVGKRDSSRSDRVSLLAGNSLQHRKWQAVEIPLSRFSNLPLKSSAEIQHIIFSQNSNDGEEHTIYIDDIEIRPSLKSATVTAIPKISSAKGYSRHVDITWAPLTDSNIRFVKIYRAEDGKNFRPIDVQIPMIQRYADYTGETGKSYRYQIAFLDEDYRESKRSTSLSATTRPMSDEELMTMVQEACFRYYWEGAEPESGLARENIPGRKNMIATGASGFGMMALIAGTERKFVSREQSVKRFEKMLDFLGRTETFHGAFSHFVDGTTGKVEPFFGNRDNGGDLVETSFLVQGLIAARSYFNRSDNAERLIREKITRIWKAIEWSWYRRYPDSKFLYWHWSPDQEWVINHQLIGWNETMVTYLLAMASPTHSIPASMYYTGWANQDSTGINYRRDWGRTNDGSSYKNGKTYFGIPLDIGVSNGGPLFFTHYSYLGFDPKMINDKYTNYFSNNQNIALINYRYCVENPKGFQGYSDSAWGLTASDGPFSYSADEPVLHQDRGKIAPTGAISSFPYTPVESMRALRNYYNNYGHFLWGEYGFRDAFNLTENWCSDLYMGLNQAPMVVMIENHRTGLLWNLFMKDPEMTRVLKTLKETP